MRKNKETVVILFFAFLTFFIFRDYFFKNKVPFPSNLLISFYQPWTSYKWDGYAKGPPNKPMGFDNLRIFYPLRKLTIDQLKLFQWPLWNPYSFSGNTQLATYQSAVFHPASFIFFLLPQIDAWSIIIIFQPFLSLIFMYLFLREMALSKKASIFGAVTFAFSGFMIVWWEESFMSVYSSLFLPLILYSVEKLIKKISFTYFIVLIVGLSFSILSGWFQMTFYVWGFSIIWILFRFFDLKLGKKLVLYFILAFLLSVLICAVHLLPSIEAYLYSARGTTDAKYIFDTYLMQWYHLVTYFVPDFFGNPAVHNYFGGRSFYHEKVLFIGVIPLILALYEIINFKSVDSKRKFFILFWIVSLSLGFSLPTSWMLLYDLKIPFVSVILPSRLFFLTTFSISVLAAFGIERFIVQKEKKKLIIIYMVIGLIFTLISAYAYYFKITSQSTIHKNVPIRNLLMPLSTYFLFGLLLTFSIKKRNLINKIYYIILAISFLSSAFFANKYLYFSERKYVFPNTPLFKELNKISGINRIWGVGNGYLDRNFATYYGLFSPEGYDSFYIRRYGELLYAAQNKGKYSYQIPRTDAVISGVKDLKEVFGNVYREKIISLLGVRYIVAEKTDVLNTLSNVVPVWSDAKFTIYDNKKALPRVLLLNDYIVKNSSKEILDSVFNIKTNLSKTVVLEEDPYGFSKNTKKAGIVEIISYKPNKLIIHTQSESDSILFLSDNYYPGWRAYVDGKDVKIYRSNYSFRSVVVPGGKHVVIFDYRPFSFYSGLIITILGILASVIIGIKIKYTQN